MIIVKKRFLVRVVLISTLSIFLHGSGWAQPDDDDLTPDPGDPGGDPDLPIDTNILLLVGAGVGYGLKKSWEVKQRLKRKKDGLQTTTANYEDFIK